MEKRETKRVGKYEIGRTLGEGTFGKVKHGLNVETNEHVAIKVLDKDKIQKQNMGNQIKREISIMKMIAHRFIVGMKEVLASKSKIFIVLELVTGGELFDYIVKEGRFSEEKARHYAQQLVEGVDYCHRMGICHRDLKPENLLLDESKNLKISDFGLSSLYVGDADGDGTSRTELLHTTCGTPNYVAPEVLADRGYDGKKADVWSIGVIIYVLLAGFLPFDESTIVALFQKIQKAEFTYPSWFSEEARSLLNSMLVSSPSDRLSLSQVKEHLWMKWEEVEGVMTSRRQKASEAAALQSKSNVDSAAMEDKELEDDEDDFGEAENASKKNKEKSSVALLHRSRSLKNFNSRVLNVFDLVNRCGGFALSKMFMIPTVSTNSTSGNVQSGVLRYVSDWEPENIMSEFCGLLRSHHFFIMDEDTTDDINELDPARSYVCIPNQTKVKAWIQPPGKGNISISGFVFVLTSSLTLFEIRRGKGDIFEFYNIHEKIIEPALRELGVVRATFTAT